MIVPIPSTFPLRHLPMLPSACRALPRGDLLQEAFPSAPVRTYLLFSWQLLMLLVLSYHAASSCHDHYATRKASQLSLQTVSRICTSPTPSNVTPQSKPGFLSGFLQLLPNCSSCFHTGLLPHEICSSQSDVFQYITGYTALQFKVFPRIKSEVPATARQVLQDRVQPPLQGPTTQGPQPLLCQDSILF